MRRAASFLACLFLMPLAAWGVELPREFVTSQSGSFAQGGMVVLHLTENTQVKLNGETLPQIDGRTVLGFGRDATLAQRLEFKRKNKGKNMAAHVPLKLAKRDYNIQRIDGLPPAMVTPPEEAWPRIARGSKLKKAARAIASQYDGFAEGFVWPTKGRITGVYGSQRFYNGEPRRPHFGIDIAAPRGTPVTAPASGTVTLAEPDMYFEGGLVFIDHGLSVTSAYMHLDSLKVKVGDKVKRGDVIATVGSTGRSTGPHLDWRMFWRGARIDPALLAAGQPNE
jgi:murein DD-endopeptidase MepM/ murein hydrolase activator NlpD